MRKDYVKQVRKSTTFLIREAKSFSIFFKIYLQDKSIFISNEFEKQKNSVVKGVLIRRGRRNRIFLHVSIMVILTLGVIISPFISDSQLLPTQKNMLTFAQEQKADSLTLSQDNVFQTRNTSLRDKPITYTVQKGDTVSSIASKFGISEDTIKWANEMDSDDIAIGDTLKIPPVTGIIHKVQEGDTIYSIAKKYKVDAQAIADFPFNDFANPQTFSLVTGQIVVVPDGIKPEEQVKPQYLNKQTLYAVGNMPVGGAGFAWPISGTLNQGFYWYHPGIDIGAPYGAPIVSAQNGVVSSVYTSGWNYGYGTHVVIAGDNGYSTLYAHMSGVGVSVGQRVTAGKTLVGWIGLTGRTTGPHLHFEVRSSGGNLNPLSFLQ